MERAQRWGVGALIGAGAALVVVPLLFTIYLSVFDENIIVFPPRGYTLRWYGGIIAQFGGALRTSATVAVAAALLSLLLGIPAAIGLDRARFRGRSAVSTFLLAPLTVPGIAIGLGLYVVAIEIEERSGAALAGSVPLLVAAHGLIALPWVVRLGLAALSNGDGAAEEAAASLGAAPLRVLWRVTLPRMRSGIVAGALFAFIVSFENLELTLFLVAPGTTTLPIAVLQYLQYHIDPLIAAVAVVQIVLVAAALVALDRQIRLAEAIA